MTIYYLDISSAQGDISLKGALAAAIKVTEGTSYVNPFYASRMAEAAHEGTFGFAYHFLHGGNGAGQGQYCHAHAGGTPVMVDFEPEPQFGSKPTVGDCCAFVDELRRVGGVCWLCYFPRWYWQELGSPDLGPLRQRGLRLVSSDYVAYTDASTGTGWQPYGGITPDVWQYTDRLHFNGAAVDFNAFRGSYAGKQDAASVKACLAEFRNLVHTGKVTAPAPAGGSPGGSWKEYQTAGELSLAGLAAKLNVGPASLLTNSIEHYGWLGDAMGNYIKGLAEGTVKPSDPTPKGVKLWIRS